MKSIVQKHSSGEVATTSPPNTNSGENGKKHSTNVANVKRQFKVAKKEISALK